jgi:glycosyltransferase involved in cell wall biosynthesis
VAQCRTRSSGDDIIALVERPQRRLDTLPPVKVLFLGTYDLSKPRNRILIRGLTEAGAELRQCHEPVWEAVADKSMLGPRERARYLFRVVRSYARLVRRFLAEDRPDVVWIGYLGQLDVLVLGPLARLRGVPVVWDVFISLYDTVVHDRALVPSGGAAAKLLYAWEWLGCRAANLVLMDTRAHAEYLEATYGLAPERVDFVWVGAEPDEFPPAGDVGEARADRPLEVLFYGQFIALHGIETIIQAARLLEHEDIHFSIIGSGQEAESIRALIAEHPLPKLSWEPWVPYEELIVRIRRADVCLGIFGTSGKASRVIPNKVFQVVSAQRPLVTRDSDAIRELFHGDEAGVWLVPPGDPAALARRLRELEASRSALPRSPHAALGPSVAPLAIGQRALSVLARAARVAHAGRGARRAES